MSKAVIAEDLRLRLAESIGVVDGRRAAITAKMQSHLARLETEDEAFGQAEVTALMLVNLLIQGASDLIACRALAEDERIAAEHRRLDIDGRHYSRFGLALAPVLKDVLGPSLPPRIASAWCDAFWCIIRQMAPEEAPESYAASNGARLR